MRRRYTNKTAHESTASAVVSGRMESDVFTPSAMRPAFDVRVSLAPMPPEERVLIGGAPFGGIEIDA